MCGIVGYVGMRAATPIILEGLQRLEYRGYDSAGLAVIEANGHVAVRRDAGKLQNLKQRVEQSPTNGHIGVGHTRWATHGPPTAFGMLIPTGIKRVRSSLCKMALSRILWHCAMNYRLRATNSSRIQTPR